MQSNQVPGYFVMAAVCERIGVSESRVRQLISEVRESGEDVGVRAGRNWLFSISDVQALEELHQQKRRYRKSAASG